MSLSDNLKKLGLALPPPPKALGGYVPARRSGGLLFIAGQLPMVDGSLMASGPVPSRCPIDLARQAARQCVLNALSAAADVAGGPQNIVGVVRVGVFVLSDDGFDQQPQIANAASDLLVELLGNPGRHARAAVGTNALPLNASVEIEFVFEVE